MKEQRRATAAANVAGGTGGTPANSVPGGTVSSSSTITTPPPTVSSHLTSYNLERARIRDEGVSFRELVTAGRSSFLNSSTNREQGGQTE